VSISSTTDHGRPQFDHGQPRYRPISDALAITPTVSVVIPVKNEARNLPLVLRSLPAWVDEVVLVDGHSVDDTVAVARECRPDIKIVTQPKKGKGDALRAGFKECTSDIVVMMDGDGSTAGSEIVRFVSALVAGADYAKGSRFASSGGSDDITPGRRMGNRLLSGIVNLAFGTRYTDLCYGWRIRDRDRDEHSRCQGGPARTGGSQPRAAARARREQSPCVLRWMEDPQGHQSRSLWSLSAPATT
jgi:glycosyltransferase involved in cell wall biosynthesis